MGKTAGALAQSRQCTSVHCNQRPTLVVRKGYFHWRISMIKQNILISLNLNPGVHIFFYYFAWQNGMTHKALQLYSKVESGLVVLRKSTHLLVRVVSWTSHVFHRITFTLNNDWQRMIIQTSLFGRHFFENEWSELIVSRKSNILLPIIKNLSFQMKFRILKNLLSAPINSIIPNKKYLNIYVSILVMILTNVICKCCVMCHLWTICVTQRTNSLQMTNAWSYQKQKQKKQEKNTW